MALNRDEKQFQERVASVILGAVREMLQVQKKQYNDISAMIETFAKRLSDIEESINAASQLNEERDAITRNLIEEKRILNLLGRYKSKTNGVNRVVHIPISGSVKS